MSQYNNARLIRNDNSLSVLTAKATTGFGTGKKVEQFTNLMFELIGAGTVTATVKAFVSYQEVEPVWADPFTISNAYYPVACLNLDTQGAIIAGSTGISLTADGGKHFIVSSQGAKWINFQVSAISAGNVSAIVNPYNNQ